MHAQLPGLIGSGLDSEQLWRVQQGVGLWQPVNADCVRARLQEVKQTNFFQELRFMLYTYRSVYILFGLIIPLAFVIMSGVVPFMPIPHAMIMRNAYLLVPVGILCFGHTMGPILLSPPLMLVKF